MGGRRGPAHLLKRAMKLRITPEPGPQRGSHETRVALPMTLDKILNPTEVAVLKRRDTELLLKKMREATRTDSRALSKLRHTQLTCEFRLADGARALDCGVQASKAGATLGGTATQGFKQSLPEFVFDQRRRSEPKLS